MNSPLIVNDIEGFVLYFMRDECFLKEPLSFIENAEVFMNAKL